MNEPIDIRALLNSARVVLGPMAGVIELKQLPRLTILLTVVFAISGCVPAPTASPVSQPAALTATQTAPPSQSAEPLRFPVAPVVGMPAAEAKKQLADAGFAVRVKWVPNEAEHGRVIEQTPSGGEAPAGSTVVLDVSLGPQSESETRDAPDALSPEDAAAARAFDQRSNGVALSGQGVVTRVLSDDISGSRHQRFILRLASGQTLLVAHNIDIAPRLPSLTVGDSVSFKGDYEWNSEGGTVHWTHHDPNGTHPGGWLKYNGSTYQ